MDKAARVILNIAANMDTDQEMITLVAADGTVEIEREIAIPASALIANLDQDTEIVHLEGFSAEILTRAVEYMKFHAVNPAVVTGAVCPHDAKLVDLPPADIIKLTNAAYYLGIHGLAELGTAKFVIMTAGKTDEDVRALFGVPACMYAVQTG
jgi:hypothetical protein